MWRATLHGVTTPLRLEAPAKLNLSLAVTGRRQDGFHELASVMVLLELADRLLLMPGCSGLRIDGITDEVPTEPSRNLAWRGLVAGLGDQPDLACLTVDKRIPATAGLGGGSSDAAAAWRLGRRWRSGLDAQTSRDELVELAAIGADVPFFAAAVPAALVTGIGEHVEPLEPPDPPLEVVLAHPPFGLSTTAVFAELRRDEFSGASAVGSVQPGLNDLLPAARRLRPELDELMALVTAAGGEPHLTGSGPTLFTATRDPERADAIAARLERAGVRTTRTRTRTTAASIEVLAEEE